MKITQANRTMLSKKGLSVRLTTKSVSVFRRDGKRMTPSQFELTESIMRKSGVYQFPKRW